MSRFDITLGLLASIATIFLVGMIGLTENERMAKTTIGWERRSIENGAAMFDAYCADCHGPNAGGGRCPPLNQFSGLHGGSIGPGVACRMEELGWVPPSDTYGYVYSVIATGRQYSTRSNFPGNRIVPTPLPPGAPTPESVSAPAMAMPAWSQEAGGPLRPDQIRDLTNYIVAFAEYLPADPEDAKAMSCGPGALPPTATVAPPTVTASPTPEVELEGEEADSAESPLATATP